MRYRCHSIREEKRKKEEEEEEARRQAEEERRKKEEEEARRKAEEEAKRRMEEEARRRRAEEEVAAARKAQQQREEEERRRAREPQTREDPDIELVNEEMLDENLFVPEEEENGSSHTDEELGLKTNGTTSEAGPQLDEKEEDGLENQTQGRPVPKSVLPSNKVTPNALKSTSSTQGEEPTSSTTSTSSHAEERMVQPALINKQPSSRKREERRRRGLEHNKRETERAAASASSSSTSPSSSSSSSEGTSKDQTSPPNSKNQETSKLKERSDSKELDQYTFVAWKVKDDKGGKKEAKGSPPSASPVRPSTLPLVPVEATHEKYEESMGTVNLQRRSGAIKEKPEKWKGRRSNEEHSKGTSSPPLHNREERTIKPQPYVCSTLFSCLSFFLLLNSGFLLLKLLTYDFSAGATCHTHQLTVFLQILKVLVLF